MGILDNETITRNLRDKLKKVSSSLPEKDKVLALHLSRVIMVGPDLSVVNPEHSESLEYLDSVSGIMREFDEESAEAIVKELGL